MRLLRFWIFVYITTYLIRHKLRAATRIKVASKLRFSNCYCLEVKSFSLGNAAVSNPYLRAAKNGVSHATAI
jgi:hypothetical protein